MPPALDLKNVDQPRFVPPQKSHESVDENKISMSANNDIHRKRRQGEIFTLKGGVLYLAIAPVTPGSITYLTPQG